MIIVAYVTFHGLEGYFCWKNWLSYFGPKMSSGWLDITHHPKKGLASLSLYCVCPFCCLNLWIRFYSTLHVYWSFEKCFVQRYSRRSMWSRLALFFSSSSRLKYTCQLPWFETRDHERNEKRWCLSFWKISAYSQKEHEYSSPLFSSLTSHYSYPISVTSQWFWSWEADLWAKLLLLPSLAMNTAFLSL
jgi:hypothetical protein